MDHFSLMMALYENSETTLYLLFDIHIFTIHSNALK